MRTHGARRLYGRACSASKECSADCAESRSEPGTREMVSQPISWQPSPETCVRCSDGCQPASWPIESMLASIAS